MPRGKRSQPAAEPAVEKKAEPTVEAAPSAPALKTYEGACHCGKVKFAAEMDLSGGIVRCNCSHCAIKGLVMAFIPNDKLTITAGEEFLTEYRFNKKVIAHRFCKDCGVQPFGVGDNNGGAMVNLRCLKDFDYENKDLKVTLYDGKNM